MLCLLNATCLYGMGKDEAGQAWLEAALDLERIAVGGGKNVFEARYGEAMKTITIFNLFKRC